MAFFVRLSLLALMCSLPSVTAEAEMCAIDMGSNSVRRIVGSFDNGRYSQRNIEVRTLSVGDDVTRDGRITDARLAEIERTLAEFERACAKDGAAPIVAVGTAAYRRRMDAEWSESHPGSASRWRSPPRAASRSWPTWLDRSGRTASR
jgi:hypothetical protein